ncbi:hypothetical protein RUM43_013865 [Polyplax serrata]|uniref:Smr domain-containing protein n=1 Tax=Polyplax serrata TaxID=468196 RepID=A0AAN8PIR5_POLSC
MSQKKSVHDSPQQKGSDRKKTNRKNRDDQKIRENFIRKLYETFQDHFDLALIASVAHTCQWDIQRATEALVILSGRKDSFKNSKTDKNGTTSKAKSLPGTLKQDKSDRKGLDCTNPGHYNSTNSLSSGQVWQRHYKSKPQSPGLLTMIPPHSKEVVKLKTPSSNRSSFKSTETEYKKASAVVKRIQQHVQNGIKVMILMRGVPGSGKTHFAQVIVSLVTGNEFAQHIMSTDDYFVMLGRGVYAYDYNQLPQAHNWNQKRVLESVKRGINPVVVDNTNTQAWEMQPYVTIAVEHGYLVEVLEPLTEWRNKEAELAKRNTHSVPREKIRQMLERYEPGWTGEKLIKLFGLKYRQPGCVQTQDEVKKPTNSLLAQHRQHGTISVPEKPKRKKNGYKKGKQQVTGVEISEDKEKQLEELNKFFAEYGKTMDSFSRQKVLESGVPISEVVSRMRKLQGNILPLPNPNYPSQSQAEQFKDTIASVPNYSKFSGDYFSDTQLPERDIPSSSNASETSECECETDTDAELPKWNEMKKYLKYRSGDFLNCAKNVEDDYVEGRLTEKYKDGYSEKVSNSHIFDKQDELLSLLDFNLSVTPVSISQDATAASCSQDDLSLVNYEGIENTSSRKLSSSSSEEQETQMLSLQESLRDVLLENNQRVNELSLENNNNTKPGKQSINIDANSKQIDVDLSDSLMKVLDSHYDKSPNKNTADVENECTRGAIPINESLLQILVNKYSADDVVDSETAAINFRKQDNGSNIVGQSVKSPDLEGVPLPCIPPDGSILPTLSKSEQSQAPNISNFDWASKQDKFEEIVSSWNHIGVKESKSVGGPKDQRCKNPGILGAIKRAGISTIDKSPEELLGEIVPSWSSSSFTSSWEGTSKGVPHSGVQNLPQYQRKSASKTDSCTNTCHDDFDLWKKNDETVTKLLAHSRNINPNYTEPVISKAHKSDVLMLDKSSMTADMGEVYSYGNALDTLSGMFPDISQDHLIDIFDKCKGNLLWAIEVLLESPQNLASTPRTHETDPILYNDAKAIREDPDYISLQNIAISDGKKTIKRKKDKKSNTSELSLMLKKQIEESIQISEDFYQDKTLFLKKLRHGEIEFGDEPMVHMTDVTNQSIPDKLDEQDSEEDEEETTPMKLDPDFFKRLIQLFGPVDTKAVSPIINIPLSLAQQLYDCWVESVNKQVEDMQNDYVKMLMEDELLAKAFQEQEFEYKQPDLREIMDMELAMLLYKQNQAHLHDYYPETIASKLSKQLLFEAYPKLDKKMLSDLFESEGRSFHKTVDVLSAQENQSPLTVVASNFLATHGNKLLEHAKSEELKKNLEGVKKPVIMVKPRTTKKEDASQVKSMLVVNPIEYRQRTAQLHQQRNECCRLAQEAFRKKSYSVASYFSHIASLYKDQIKELSKEPFPTTLFDDKTTKEMTKIDLHFLLVSEALQIIDLYLDHHIKELRRKSLTTISIDLITGRGQHSFKGKSKIKPAVMKRLEHRQISFAIVNPGMLKVVIHKNDLLSDEM